MSSFHRPLPSEGATVPTLARGTGAAMWWIGVDVDIRAGCSWLVVMIVIAHFRPRVTDEATDTSAGRLGVSDLRCTAVRGRPACRRSPGRRVCL